MDKDAEYTDYEDRVKVVTCFSFKTQHEHEYESMRVFLYL